MLLVCVVVGVVVGAREVVGDRDRDRDLEEGELEMEEDGERERRRWGEVWVAMSRWKSSVGSESVLEAEEVLFLFLSLLLSARSRCLSRLLGCAGMEGMWLTFSWSLSFSFSRLCRALLASSWRDEVSDWSMGWNRYLLAP